MIEHFIPDGDSTIRQAVLFSYRAYVTRQAECELEQGMQLLVVELTAHEVDSDSVQAKVFGKGEILSVQYQSRPAKEVAQQDLRDLFQQEQQLKQEKSRLEALQKSLLRQQSLLDSVAEFSKVQVPREIQTHLPDREHLQQLLAYLDDNGSSLIDRQQQLNQQFVELERELNKLQRRIKQLRRQTNPDSKVIEILFNSALPQQVSLEASYLVGHASWQPIYKVDVPLDLSSADLSRFASVTQNSGEAWNEVELTLSDAMPSHSGALPQARSWWLIDQQRYPEPMLRGALGAGAPPPAMAAMVAEEESEGIYSSELDDEELSEAELLEAEVEDRRTSFEYRMQLPMTLPSDAKEGLLPIDHNPLEGKFYYYCVPQTDPLAYLVYATKPDASWPPGRVNIHFGGRFVGKAQLNDHQAGEEMLFNLGPDRGVKIQRKCIHNKKAETFFGKVERNNVARDLLYRIHAENLKPNPIELHIHDPLPISQTDRFQVKLLDLSPKPDESDWQGREGVQMWKLQLQPQEKRSLDIHFTVKHPKDSPPYGL